MKKQFLLTFFVSICISSSFYITGDVLGAQLVTHCVSNTAGLQNALGVAQSNGAPDLIKVVQGTYNGNFSHSSSQGYSITLRGGYNAGCLGRVIDPINTVLDGGGSGRVVVLDNSNGGNVEIEGFTIRNGQGTNSGGGLTAASTSSTGSGDDVIIKSNIATGNISGQYGAGIYAYSTGEVGSGEITISGNTVSANNAASDGGGIHASSSSTSGTMGTINIANNIVTGNTSGDKGGGIMTFSDSGSGSSSPINLEGNTISANVASYVGGVSADSNGSIGSGAITIKGNKVSDNNAPNRSSAISAVSNASSGTAGAVNLTGNVITGNSSNAALDLRSLSPSGTAGVITCVNNVIAENTSTSPFGGAYVESYTATGTLEPVYFMNNTVTGNSATQTGGITIRSFTGEAYVYNNIIWGNAVHDITLDVATAYGYNNNYSATHSTWNGGSGGNLNSDPLFVGGGIYRLTFYSPCIDSGLNGAIGIPSTDYEGDARIIDGNLDSIATVDMGADEFRCAADPVKNINTNQYNTTLQAAYALAGDGDTIRAQEATFTGLIVFDREIDVTIDGGYNCGFSTITGLTGITNSLTIAGSGTVTLGNVVIM